MENENNNLAAIDTLNKLKSTLLNIEIQILGFLESPNEKTENDFDFTITEASLKRIDVLIEYINTGNFTKEIKIRTY